MEITDELLEFVTTTKLRLYGLRAKEDDRSPFAALYEHRPLTCAIPGCERPVVEFSIRPSSPAYRARAIYLAGDDSSPRVGLAACGARDGDESHSFALLVADIGVDAAVELVKERCMAYI